MKTIRKPTLNKSNMRGNVEAYKKLLHEIEQWNHSTKAPDSKLEGTIYGLGYAMDDMAYHGWFGENTLY